MTPHEHYRQAERLLAEAAKDTWPGRNLVAVAQVHATLATTHLTIDPEAQS
jgi:hypothetical protein